MEVLTFAGLPTVLFLDMPTPEQLARFAGYRGIGIAGVARSRSPAWMERHLPQVFRALARTRRRSPTTRSARPATPPPMSARSGGLELAAPILGDEWHPLVVAAPAIARYQAFGNLFAVAAMACATGWTGTRACLAIRHARWTRPMCGFIWAGRPA